MTHDRAKELSHFDAAGQARMVDVGGKMVTRREAVAAGCVSMSEAAFNQVLAGRAGKGDVLGTARLAGIMAAKKVDTLIPLAHSLPIDGAEVLFELDEDERAVRIQARAVCTGRTGVEMEALTAVTVAALTVYDMCKAVDRAMRIENIRLIAKSGGRSGNYEREAPVCGRR